MKALTSQDESQRLEALRRYRILDTPSDAPFDHIAEMAATLFHAPIAVISLVDHDRIWFKAHHGIDEQHVTREGGLCASAILSPEVYHLRDAAWDPRANNNSLVRQPPGVRFYAAAPLRSSDGFNLGTLAVMPDST